MNWNWLIINNENVDELIAGGYVRYVNMNEELKWGGILVKKISPKKLSRMKLVLKNTSNNYWNIKYKKFLHILQEKYFKI